ncbi:MAG: CoA pyrophosphatase [Jatrophihabitans sp.]|nr:MAG: CoA pyrophosphatase [Jatrophihabitans sp.]
MSEVDAAVPAWLRPLVDAVTAEPPPAGPLTPPADGSGRPSAVLVAFGQTPRGPGVLLIERSPTLRRHPGQVAFPGGAVEASDAHSEAAALREAQEEVGLDPRTVTVLLRLPELYIPRSGFRVTPVLSWWRAPHPIAAVDRHEVVRAALVPVADLTDPGHRFTVNSPSGRFGPGFEADGLFVWGFTALLLDRLLTLGGWERPWDPERLRRIPDALLGLPPA